MSPIIFGTDLTELDLSVTDAELDRRIEELEALCEIRERRDDGADPALMREYDQALNVAALYRGERVARQGKS